MRERCFKVVRSRSKNYLVTVNGLTLNHKCDVTELRLVEYGEEVTLVLVSHSCLAIGQAGEGAAQRDCIRCIRLVLIRLVSSQLRRLYSLCHNLWRVSTICRCCVSIVCHVLIQIADICLGCLSTSSWQALIVNHHAVYLLGHIDLVVSWLPLFLVGLALLAIAIFVESAGGTSVDRLLFLFYHITWEWLDRHNIGVALTLYGLELVLLNDI